jgi:PAS domain S-box-containing protein
MPNSELDLLYFEEAIEARIVLDSVGTIIYANAKFTDLVNTPKIELRGKLLPAVFQIAEADVFLEILKESFKSKVSFHTTLRNQQMKCHLDATYISNETFLCVVSEVIPTQFEVAGDLISFVSESPGSVAMFDTDMNYRSCSVSWANDWAIAKLGFDRESIKGENHYNIFSDVKDSWKEIHSRGLNGELLHNDRDNFINENGELVWLKWQVRPWNTKSGDIGGILLSTDTITDQVETEIALKKSEEKLNLFFSQSIDGFFVMEGVSPIKWDNTVDRKKQIQRVFDEFRITKVNEAFAKTYGLTTDQILGYTYRDFFKYDIERGYQSIAEMLDSRKQTVVNRDANSLGHEIWVEGNYICLFNDDDELTATFGIQRDITKRAQDEKDLEKMTKDLIKSNNELQQFAYITSHDLRAPVVNLKSLIGFYDQNLIHENNQEIFEKIELSANQLGDTLSELVEVVAVKKSELEQNTLIKFDHKVHSLLTSIEGLIEEYGAKVNLDFSELESITYPNSHLTSFIQNLVTNALKYRSHQRACVIDISTFKSKGDSCLRVRDNGIGIDLELYGDRLFGLYQKFHNIANSKGLGLYLVKTQLELLDGKIEVESEVGVGTTFTLYLKDQKKSSSQNS